jgi:putative flippase GtrA
LQALATRMMDASLALLERFRYLKFGIVGASGTAINMVVLFLSQEYLFKFIETPQQRLYLSLALAIFIATINNFTWNRLWTWADRMHAHEHPNALAMAAPRGLIASQFLRYCVASWLGIALNYGLTLWAAQFMHYLLGNLLSILVASVVNFVTNDRWTFRGAKLP